MHAEDRGRAGAAGCTRESSRAAPRKPGASTALARHSTHPTSNPRYRAGEAPPTDQPLRPPDHPPPCSTHRYFQSVVAPSVAERTSRHENFHNVSSLVRGTRLSPPPAADAPGESDNPAEHLAVHAQSRFRHSSRHPTGKDGCLNLPRSSTSAQHRCKKLRYLIQSCASRNVLRALESSTCHQTKCCPASCRCVMKARLQGDIAIMQTVRIELHLRSTRRAAEEINHSTLPHHID